jgi:pyridinium-3,5-bisthiocarboxylic acid mononucleotide nickel chelatase
VPVLGKKGRLATQVQLLVRMEGVEAAADACFRETTTLGLRTSTVQRRSLERATVESGAARPVRVKVAARPGGARTAKAELDDLASQDGQQARQALRRAAEADALQKTEQSDD